MRVEAKIAGMLPPDYLASLHEILRDYPLLFFRGPAAGGEGRIRTHGTLARTTVFETAPIGHSGTSPGIAVAGL